MPSLAKDLSDHVGAGTEPRRQNNQQAPFKQKVFSIAPEQSHEAAAGCRRPFVRLTEELESLTFPFLCPCSLVLHIYTTGIIVPIATNRNTPFYITLPCCTPFTTTCSVCLTACPCESSWRLFPRGPSISSFFPGLAGSHLRASWSTRAPGASVVR